MSSIRYRVSSIKTVSLAKVLGYLSFTAKSYATLSYLYPMNFLSHFYFEQQNPDSNMVMGTVLPDLVKNASKDWNFYPQKNEALFMTTHSIFLY